MSSCGAQSAWAELRSANPRAASPTNAVKEALGTFQILYAPEAFQHRPEFMIHNLIPTFNGLGVEPSIRDKRLELITSTSSSQAKLSCHIRSILVTLLLLTKRQNSLLKRILQLFI